MIFQQHKKEWIFQYYIWLAPVQERKNLDRQTTDNTQDLCKNGSRSVTGKLVSKNTAMVTCRAEGESAAVTASHKTQSCLHCGESPAHLQATVQLCQPQHRTVHKDLESHLHFYISDCARNRSCNACWNTDEIIKIDLIFHQFFAAVFKWQPCSGRLLCYNSPIKIVLRIINFRFVKCI